LAVQSKEAISWRTLLTPCGRTLLHSGPQICTLCGHIHIVGLIGEETKRIHRVVLIGKETKRIHRCRRGLCAKEAREAWIFIISVAVRLIPPVLSNLYLLTHTTTLALSL
jgi:hypothetical protein